MYYDVVEAQVVGELTLKIRFADGLTGIVKFLPSCLYGVFEKLKNSDFFNQLTVADGFIAWADGFIAWGDDEVDLAPDRMYQEISQAGEWAVQ
jgi:hypothetical protein